MSSCDSSIFIFATAAAARRWPVTPQKEAALRAAMSHTIPRNFKRASQASKALHQERKKQTQWSAVSPPPTSSCKMTNGAGQITPNYRTVAFG